MSPLCLSVCLFSWCKSCFSNRPKMKLCGGRRAKDGRLEWKRWRLPWRRRNEIRNRCQSNSALLKIFMAGQRVYIIHLVCTAPRFATVMLMTDLSLPMFLCRIKNVLNDHSCTSFRRLALSFLSIGSVCFCLLADWSRRRLRCRKNWKLEVWPPTRWWGYEPMTWKGR